MHRLNRRSLLSAVALLAAVPATAQERTVRILSGAAADVMLAFQVPIMRDAGLAIATAAAIAGARGFAQLLGRLPLGLVLRVLTARQALALAQALGAAAALMLLGAGAVPVAVAYGLVAGIATGAGSPLQGIHTAELVEHEHLGLLLAATGSWIPAILLTAAGFAGAALLLASSSVPRLLRRPEPAPASGGARR